MNLPNKLTMLRIILIPVFLVLVLVESIPLHYLWALLVYLIACFTDTLDGHIARSRGLVTDFGKLMARAWSSPPISGARSRPSAR